MQAMEKNHFFITRALIYLIQVFVNHVKYGRKKSNIYYNL